MSLDHLPWIAERLTVRRIESGTADGFEVVRTDTSAAEARLRAT